MAPRNVTPSACAKAFCNGEDRKKNGALYSRLIDAEHKESKMLGRGNALS